MHPTSLPMILVVALGASIAALLPEQQPLLIGTDGGPDRGAEAMFAALAAGDRGAIRELLGTEGFSFHGRDEGGRTTLMAAIEARMPEVAEELIRRGVPIEARADDGGSALCSAVRAGEVSIVTALLDRGADPGVEVPGGGSLLAEALATGRAASAKLLLDQGALGMGGGRAGEPIVMEAVRGGSEWLVWRVLSSGSAVEVRDAAGDTPGHVLARLGHAELVRPLWKAGLPMDAANRNGETALHVALAEGHGAVAAELLAHGASAGIPCPNGIEPLHVAVLRADAASVQALLKRGADPNLRLPDGRSPTEAALAGRDLDCVRVLLDYGGAPGPALYNAVVENDIETFAFLMGIGVDVNPCRKDPPLAAAVRCGRADMAEALLLAGADPMAVGAEGQSAFHLAVAMDDAPLVKAMLEAGANPDAPFAERVTKEFAGMIREGGSIKWYFRKDRRIVPLMVAADSGNHELAMALLDHGARRNTWTRRRGMYPISFASWRSDVRMMQILLGRDPDNQERWIEVDLSEQKAHVYNSGGEILLSTRVSTGKRGYRTRTGEFVITNKNRRHRSNIYHCAMPYFQRLSCADFGFHEGYVPGYPASHGCLRVPRGNAAKLWKLTEVGDRVVIVP